MIKSKKIILSTFVSAFVIVAPVIVAVSCGSQEKNGPVRQSRSAHNKEATNVIQFREKDIEFIKQNDDDSNQILDEKKIKMVSLGDSVSAGYSQLDAKDHRGHSENGKISGISYGSYIARAFNRKNKLDEFNNFGIGGATTDTLRNQIDPSFKLGGASKKRSELINEKLVFPEKGEKERFTKIQSKIKEANLVTISIGANDILSTLKLGGLTISELLEKGADKMDMSGGIASLISYEEKAFNTAVLKASNNLIAIISKIKSLNSNAKIVMVGYPMPITQLSSIIKMVKGKKGPLALEILESLDNIGRKIAKKFKTVDYIDGYIKKTWDDNSLLLAPELLDIHPGARGYKMMAATVLSRLTQTDHKEVSEKEAFRHTISKKRLKESYEVSINEYVDVKFPLTAEEQKVDGLAESYKLLRFAANLAPKLIGMLNSPASPTIDAVNNYQSYSIVETFMKMLPFVKQLFRSAEFGLSSKDTAVKNGVEQDSKFILATLSKIAMGKGFKPKAIYAILKSQIPEITNGELPKVKKLLDANMNNKTFTPKAIQNIIDKGQATNYLKH